MNLEDLGSVFVYLRRKSKLSKEKKNICFWRGHVRDFTEKNPEQIKWL